MTSDPPASVKFKLVYEQLVELPLDSESITLWHESESIRSDTAVIDELRRFVQEMTAPGPILMTRS